jgi:hypothetical protein
MWAEQTCQYFRGLHNQQSYMLTYCSVCGDDTDRINAGATFQPDQYCNTPCSGDPTALCGGSNAINYYTWTGLNTWNQATGNAAGQYQFLIGGLVVPLITAQGLNGKVTFVEKHGTGPPNSTGAYELDLSQINDFNAAWRTMNGLKTDVFCSAGLTLPDKVGRQLNIGGYVIYHSMRQLPILQNIAIFPLPLLSK